MKKIFAALAFVAASAGAQAQITLAQAQPMASQPYVLNAQQPQQPQPYVINDRNPDSFYGQIVSVRSVRQYRRDDGGQMLATVGGGAVGAIAGRMIGGGTLGAIAGGAGGAYVGRELASGGDQAHEIDIAVRRQDGSVVQIRQADDGVQYGRGEMVQARFEQGNWRVVR